MLRLPGSRRFVFVACAIGLALAACTDQVEPAQRAISDIGAILSAETAEAAKYAPDRLSSVQSGYDGLKASFDRKDYAAVLRGAPEVMSAAQALAGVAAAAREQQLNSLKEKWSGMATLVPDAITDIQNRIDALSKKTANKTLPADLDAARSGLSSAVSLWSKAQAAFATGNLPEAVTTVQSVTESLRDLESGLKMPLLPDPAAAAGARS